MYAFEVVWFPGDLKDFMMFFWIFDPWSKRSYLTHMCWGLKPPKILFLISKDHQCLATLELTKQFFLNCKAKKADTLLGFPKSEGVSPLDG